MNSSNPLGNLFFRYRKRKQISVDGHTPGLDYQARHHGSTHAPATGHAAQHSRGGDYLGGQDSAEYDSGRSFYSPNSPHYHGPAPWHDIHGPPTPELRTPPGTRFPELPQGDPLADVHPPFDPDHQSALEITDIWRRLLSQAAYHDSADSGRLVEVVAERLGVPPLSQALVEQFMESAAPCIGDHLGLLDDAQVPELLPPPASPVRVPDQEVVLLDCTEAFGVTEPFPAPSSPEDAEMLRAPQTEIEQAIDDVITQDPIGTEPTLEDLVEEEWHQLDPFGVPDRTRMTDHYDPFRLGPPGMPMDPFGPMGPMM